MYQYRELRLRLNDMPSDLIRSVGNVRLLAVPLGRKRLDDNMSKMVWGAVTLSKDNVFRHYDNDKKRYDDRRFDIVFQRDCYQVQLMDMADCINEDDVLKRTVSMPLFEMLSRIDSFCRKDLSGLAYSDFDVTRLESYNTKSLRIGPDNKDTANMGTFDMTSLQKIPDQKVSDKTFSDNNLRFERDFDHEYDS